MASPPLSTIRQVARDFAQDNSANTANYSVSATELDEVINRYYARYKLTSEPWVQDLPASVTGLTVTAGTNTVFTSIATIRHFKDLYLSGSAGSTVRTSQALERLKPYELDIWAGTVTPPSNAPIARYSAHRIGDSTKSAANVGAWLLHFDPIPIADTYIMSRCVLEAATLSAATDVPDLTDEEGYGIAVLAGAWMAIRLGRPALAQSALAELPGSMQAIAKGLSEDSLRAA